VVIDHWLMTSYSNTKRAGVAVALTLGAMFAIAPLAQAEPVDPSTPQTEVLVPAPGDGTSVVVPSGKKMKLKGIVTRRDADTFTVRD
jgi:hypothetical protein